MFKYTLSCTRQSHAVDTANNQTLSSDAARHGGDPSGEVQVAKRKRGGRDKTFVQKMTRSVNRVTVLTSLAALLLIQHLNQEAVAGCFERLFISYFQWKDWNQLESFDPVLLIQVHDNTAVRAGGVHRGICLWVCQ